MNMFDEARSLKCMIEARKMTQRELAKSLGVSTSYVANKLRLLTHSEKMQEMIAEASLTERHARALLRISGEADREAAFHRILNEKMSVERAEAMIETFVERERPRFIGRGDGCDGVTRFLDNLKASERALAALGVKVKQSMRYHEKQLCIYITIDEK